MPTFRPMTNKTMTRYSMIIRADGCQLRSGDPHALIEKSSQAEVLKVVGLKVGKRRAR